MHHKRTWATGQIYLQEEYEQEIFKLEAPCNMIMKHIFKTLFLSFEGLSLSCPFLHNTLSNFKQEM